MRTPPEEVKQAMLSCCWTYTRSAELLKECSELFDKGRELNRRGLPLFDMAENKD